MVVDYNLVNVLIEYLVINLMLNYHYYCLVMLDMQLNDVMLKSRRSVGAA